MNVLMYVYARPEVSPQKLNLVYCVSCRRPLFKTNSQNLTLANSDFTLDAIPPGANYIEHMCHSCKTVYRILFQ